MFKQETNEFRERDKKRIFIDNFRHGHFFVAFDFAPPVLLYPHHASFRFIHDTLRCATKLELEENEAFVSSCSISFIQLSLKTHIYSVNLEKLTFCDLRVSFNSIISSHSVESVGDCCGGSASGDSDVSFVFFSFTDLLPDTRWRLLAQKFPRKPRWYCGS